MIARVVRRKVSAPETFPVTLVPLEVYILMVHAKEALDDGNIECATTRLELALRRCER